MESVYIPVKNFISSLDLFFAFVASVSALAVITLVECLLARFNRLSKAKNFLHLTLSASLTGILLAIALINGDAVTLGEKLFFPILNLAVGCLTLIPVRLTNGKIKIKKEQIDLARILDREYKRANPAPNFIAEEKPLEVTRERAEPAPTPQNTAEDIDFTHVKNVIERLGYYNLAPSDKRVVSELSNNVRLAEQGEFTPDLKSKINDGLGALLKIMSKHSV